MLTLHSQTDIKEQDQALSRAAGGTTRFCIASNNIVEKSTIKSIVCVMDLGVAKRMSHNPHVRASRLEVVPITKANTAQRARRAARTEPSACTRL